MKPDNDPTIAFGLAKYLMSVEGPSSTLGLLVSVLYYDLRDLSRADWSVSHTAANRPDFIRQLRGAGAHTRRLGISVHTQHAVDRIGTQAARLHLKAICLTTHADERQHPA